MRRRLDAELVRRGLARSREHAAQLVGAGRVTVGGQTAAKPATQVDAAAPVVVVDAEPADSWVGRGAGKLDGALDALAAQGLAPEVRGRVCLDAGASTGGFTQVLLSRGAACVHAVDVGYGQLAWPLRTDERVRVHERTNVRDLTTGSLDPVPDLVVADLSFISLRLVLPALLAASAPATDLLLMVKPQFEVGRDRVGSGGVVRDPSLREDAVVQVLEHAAGLGVEALTVTASPLPGPSGNVEYFVLLRRGPGSVGGHGEHKEHPEDTEDEDTAEGTSDLTAGQRLRAMARAAVAAGPAGASAPGAER
ncbi:TlyA family RNA methyltransferase [Aquipuribacter sp. SD81]|uniref:TlyA family RNA methyltransferase n=1 Tax=Aquipuribacter sp. SD81 TaxID=3127703 RepID=UPI0030195ECC